ncbi:hypothetical protein CSV78_03925 [Sporosarcina sp. P16a]|nr:hypothetical protein CSV78_03925 [Sporosarcina sp. P16a]PIC94258.1 hypothetical protein CSV70_00565 [Sporosarcina sp. P25]
MMVGLPFFGGGFFCVLVGIRVGVWGGCIERVRRHIERWLTRIERIARAIERVRQHIERLRTRIERIARAIERVSRHIERPRTGFEHGLARAIERVRQTH